MWKTDEPPIDVRVLVSAKGKVWIGRFRPRWESETKTFGENEWAVEGKTTAQAREWAVDGWQPLPVAINAKPARSLWRPTCYLDCLMLSVRSERILRERGIKSKEQLNTLTMEALLAMKGMGVRSANEVLEQRNKPWEPYLKEFESTA